MVYYLHDSVGTVRHSTAVRHRQIPRWNAGSLLLHRDAEPDVAHLLLVVDAVWYGMMELAGHALCLWAIPYLRRYTGDDPFAPLYVPTNELCFPHEKGLVIRRLGCPALHSGTTIVPAIGAPERTESDEPTHGTEREPSSGRERTGTTEHDTRPGGCSGRLCVPTAGQEQTRTPAPINTLERKDNYGLE